MKRSRGGEGDWRSSGERGRGREIWMLMLIWIEKEIWREEERETEILHLELFRRFLGRLMM